VQLPTVKVRFQNLVNVLLALHTIFANELGTDQQGLKMLAIAIEFEMLAGHAGEYELLDLIRVHGDSGSQLPTLL